ncbi:type I DNA topoisomerase [Thermaerobacter subterraneus]|uniref:DNA topoisomerase 1 n=1 Tax=Thermaerobacter subterraneus DSM 13965 TaxID=867903 RepID=K6PY86_9FIRM|nr:type I DNA topoisomerase [Thermaerobacter subterraneus]EKP93688.1 DNA topoisomerase I, bacterial [Thermaerobacter subterraneus DSM 13965]
MPRTLIIVESPAKAKTIKKFVGRDYAVEASMGHVRDLPKSQLGVDIDDHFTPHYITIRGKGKLIERLRQQARQVDRVLLATDPDREGEAISWHLCQLLDIDESSPCRIVFHEITREAVRRALKEPRPIDENLVDAQQARRVLDRLVGYKLSPLLWRKVRRGLSAGRVQSVAVRLIVDREEEIEAFTPQEYWTLEADLVRLPGGETFTARYYGDAEGKKELPDRAAVDRLLADLEGRPFSVLGVERKERKRNPAPPFTTSTLQQEAARKLGFTVRRTMRIAQELYEGIELRGEGAVGLVTYIRTDSTRIADQALDEAAAYIAARFGAEFSAPRKQAGRRAAQAQDAHEAIRPTSVAREPDAIKDDLTPDQYKLYRLIWERFVASQMAPAVLDTVTAEIGAGPHRFRATGSTVKFPGFMKLYVEGRDEGGEGEGDEAEGMLPDLAEGDALALKQLRPEQHFTQPPPRYTEAMLVRALEEKGIGRPSTYAPIIETIQERGYVVKEDRRFRPTELGRVVTALLKEHFPDIVDVEFTARMEADLDRIEEGQREWEDVVREFYEPFSATLARAEREIQRVALPVEETDEICEKCGRRMVIKHGRYGRFLACPGFPECRNTRPLVEKTGARCPRCGGEMVQRRSRKGRVFYGCSNYPECDFTTWDRPTAETCPECGTFLVEKRSRQGVRLVCANPQCTYQREGAAETAGAGAGAGRR